MTRIQDLLGGGPGRAVASFLAIVALGISVVVGWKYLDLADCLRDKTTADSKRTSALAGPTDRERAAERALLAPGGDPRVELAETLAAHDAVDRVRRLNPPPAPTGC